LKQPHPEPWLRDSPKPKGRPQYRWDEPLRVEDACDLDESSEKSEEDVQDPADEEVVKPEGGVHSLDEEYSCEDCQIEDDGWARMKKTQKAMTLRSHSRKEKSQVTMMILYTSGN
jgi:hypothetical protein